MRLFLSLLLVSVYSYQINAQINDFEDGTTQGWSKMVCSKNQPLNSIENGRIGVSDNYLKVIGDGSKGVGSRLELINTNPEWIGEFSENYLGFYAKNPSDKDLDLRLVIKGVDGTQICTSAAIHILANSNWIRYSFNLEPENAFSVVRGKGSVEDVLLNVKEVRILHNPKATYYASSIEAALHIDEITRMILDVGENFDVSARIYPNPAKEQLNVTLSQPINTRIAVYNILGQEVLNKTASSKNVVISVSELQDGVYLVRIEAEGHVITKKFVKQ